MFHPNILCKPAFWLAVMSDCPVLASFSASSWSSIGGGKFKPGVVERTPEASSTPFTSAEKGGSGGCIGISRLVGLFARARGL